VDIGLIVPSFDTQRIQEAHITVGHILCQALEQRVLAEPPAVARRTKGQSVP